MNSCDYVVIGAGSAGGVLAARLAERSDAEVTLLEAGGPADAQAIAVPPAWPSLLHTDVDWAHTTTPQAGAAGRVLELPRGRVLGGSSSINAMAHIRGHRADFDAWAAAGNAGWSYEEVLPYFKRMEDCPDRDPRYRGRGGPLLPAPVVDPNPASAALLDAARELGYPSNEDFNGHSSEGAGWFDLLIAEDARYSVAAAYLAAAESRPNLTILTHARALRLNFADNRCTEVEFVRHGSVERIRARAETIVCGGALESPKLLLVSGVGPAEEISRLGIAPVLDLPGVGANLHDHLMVGAVYETSSPLPPPTANLAESVLVSRSGPSATVPDLHHLLLQIPLHPPELTGPASGYTIAAGLMAPRSRGLLRLASSDPSAPPVIDPKFLAEEADVAILVAGLEKARELGATAAFAELRAREVLPGPEVGDKGSLARYVAAACASYFHPVGTCRMGADGTAVVDPALRVRGLDGLRVADASVMPTIVRANTNAATMMIGEKAADLVLGAG